MPSKPILQMVRQVDRGACMRVRRCPKVAIPRPNPAPGSPTSLRPEPEQRLLPLLRNECPRLVERIKILRTVASAEKQAADIADPLATIETAAGQVKKSALFRCVLSVVLKWGNFVNHGVTDEDGCLRTRGFTFGQFGDRAVEFKATINSSFTSLHYLVVNMLAVAPELELWKLEEEMSAVAPASRVSTENVNALLVAFSDDIKIVTKELDVHSESYKRYGGFEELQRIHGRLRDLELDANDKLARAVAAATSTARFFGDETQAAKGGGGATEDFFKILNEFVVRFTAACNSVREKPARFAALMVHPEAQTSPASGTSSRSARSQAPTEEETAPSTPPPESPPGDATSDSSVASHHSQEARRFPTREGRRLDTRTLVPNAAPFRTKSPLPPRKNSVEKASPPPPPPRISASPPPPLSDCEESPDAKKSLRRGREPSVVVNVTKEPSLLSGKQGSAMRREKSPLPFAPTAKRRDASIKATMRTAAPQSLYRLRASHELSVRALKQDAPSDEEPAHLRRQSSAKMEQWMTELLP
eukprot:Polyplicarium_translucidae@DN2826_c0_g1_i6.p1